MIPQVAIVIPTFNEAENVEAIYERLKVLDLPLSWELIFVDDDSPDATAEVVKSVAARDPRVRLIRRIGRRGLSSACVEGMLASLADVLVVMDADLQHDERVLPEMLRSLLDDDKDLVVGTRYAEGGDAAGLLGNRAFISRFATWLGQRMTGVQLSDPMSGFFALKRRVVESTVRNLSQVGYKLLLDIATASPEPLRVAEVPYHFRERLHGESKLDSFVAWEYLMMLLDKSVGRFIPLRFLSFVLVGGVGVLVHLAVLAALFQWLGVGFVAAQASATLVAMTGNFLLNNQLTYRDRRLHGLALVSGWLSFVLACSVGAFANVGIAAYLHGQEAFWVLSALAGIALGAVWNYAVTSVYTWKKS